MLPICYQFGSQNRPSKSRIFIGRKFHYRVDRGKPPVLRVWLSVSKVVLSIKRVSV